MSITEGQTAEQAATDPQRIREERDHYRTQAHEATRALYQVRNVMNHAALIGERRTLDGIMGVLDSTTIGCDLQPARLDADGTAKPLTEIVGVHEFGKVIAEGNGVASAALEYVVRPTEDRICPCLFCGTPMDGKDYDATKERSTLCQYADGYRAVTHALGVEYEADGHASQPGPLADVLQQIAELKACQDREGDRIEELRRQWKKQQVAYAEQLRDVSDAYVDAIAKLSKERDALAANVDAFAKKVSSVRAETGETLAKVVAERDALAAQLAALPPDVTDTELTKALMLKWEEPEGCLHDLGMVARRLLRGPVAPARPVEELRDELRAAAWHDQADTDDWMRAAKRARELGAR